MACPAPTCFKAPIASISKCAIGCAIKGPDSKSVTIMKNVTGEPNRFVVAFCGSGTGHLTQAMKAVEILQERGLVLAGVATDTDASDKMLDEMVRPLGVPLLIIPAIELVDTEKGFIPLINPPRFLGSLMKAQDYLQRNAADIRDFFVRARAGKIFNMYHLTLARFFQLNPLPPSISITHMAAQFGLCALSYEDTRTFLEVGGKAVMDVMASIFTASGQTVPIGPLSGDGVLPPIIHLPTQLQPSTPRLILCYFLVQTHARKLDELLAKEPMPGCAFHCFTAKPLANTHSQLHSHQKQRALFQEFFSRSTGVIVSAGNETVWEAICRGVPVLTIPTEGHSEQLLNAAVHARNFPYLVRARPTIHTADLQWLVNFDSSSQAARAESVALREKVAELQTHGSPLLGGEPFAPRLSLTDLANAGAQAVSDAVRSIGRTSRLAASSPAAEGVQPLL